MCQRSYGVTKCYVFVLAVAIISSGAGAAVDYAAATSSNSRSVTFPIAGRNEAVGSVAHRRHSAYVGNIVRRVQQSIEFLSLPRSNAYDTMNVSIYVKNFIPTIINSTRQSVNVWLVSAAPVMTDALAAIQLRNPFNSILSESDEPSLLRTKVLSCMLPSLETTVDCPATPHFCGVASLQKPSTSVALNSATGRSQMLLVSVSTEVLYPKTAVQDAGCVRSVEVTAIWDPPSAANVTFRSSVALGAQEIRVYPDVLIPINTAQGPAAALSVLRSQFLPNSDPVGNLWMPLLVDDGLRAQFPFGALHARFGMTNYSAASVALVKPVGVSCAIDDSLLPPYQPLPLWNASCVMPIKDAVYGSLNVRLSDSLNSTDWMKAIRFTLESTANTSIPPRTVLCTPVISAGANPLTQNGCRMYADCSTSSLYFGVGDGSNQKYTHLMMTWSPSQTGFIPPIVADNEESDSGACSSAVTATLVYSARGGDFGSAGCIDPFQYECKADRACISSQQVCDGVIDCTDAEDENRCDRWLTIRGTGTFPLCSDVLNAESKRSVNTYLTCLKYAQSHPSDVGGLRYVVNEENVASCEMFSPSCISALTAAEIASNYTPTPYPATLTAVLVLQLDAQVRHELLFGTVACTATLSCSSRGTPRSVSVAGTSGCICTCADGFGGPACDRLLPYNSGNLLWMNFTGSIEVSAAFLLRLQLSLPVVGAVWVETAYFQVSTNTTRLLVGASRPTVLAAEWLTVKAALPSLAEVGLGVEDPDVLVGRAAQCTFDDTMRTAVCNYFRDNTATPFNAVLEAYFGMAIIDVSAFNIDGSIVPVHVCTVQDELQLPDLSYAFIQLQNAGVPTESWCPAKRTCSLGFLPGSVALLRLSFQLPPGYNSTTLSLKCNGVKRFSDASILPTVVAVPTVRDIPLDQSVQPMVITVGSSISALAFAVAAMLLAAISIVLFCVCRRRDAFLIDIARGVAESKISMKKSAGGDVMTMTTSWAIRVMEKARRGPDVAWYWHPRRHIAMWITLAFLFIAIAVVAVVFFGVAVPGNDSNYTALLQLYSDPLCNQSTVSPQASAMIRIVASGDCSATNIQGKVFQLLPTSLSAKCGPVDDPAQMTEIALKYGNGQLITCDAGAIAIPVGVCSRITFDSGAASEPLNILATCHESSTLGAYFAAFAARLPVVIYAGTESIDVPLTQAAGSGIASSSASEDDTVWGQQVPSYISANPTDVIDPVTGVHLQSFYFYDTTKDDMQTCTTQNGYMLSYGVGDSTVLIGPNTVSKELLVYQRSADILSNEVVTDIFTYEDNVADEERFIPRTPGDMPIGRFFNGYGRQVSGNTTEAVDSSLYERLYFPGIMGQDADIGGGEATVAFWMRAGPTSRGFPVACSDNWRVMSNGDSPLLKRLERMILSNNLNSDTWFDRDWSVYWAVFVDGFQQRIYFVSAGPLGQTYVGFQDSSVFSVVWDLNALGLQRVFTNRWHHIAITMEVPANEDQSGSQGSGLVIRLIVDGQTLSGSQGYLRCLVRQVQPITPLWIPRLHVPQDSAVMQGGTVVVGHINAGLYGVLVTSSAFAQTDIIALGTVPMNNFFNVNSAKFFALGFYVTFVAVALLCMMTVGVIVESIAEGKKRSLAEEAAVDTAYMSVTGVRITAEKFKISGKDFKLIPVDVVRAIVGLDRSIFATLLTEIEKLQSSPDAGRGDLMAIVWSRGQASYVPSNPQLAAMRQNFISAEKADLSRNGHFLLPSILWNDFAQCMVDVWEPQLESRIIDEDSLKNAATGGKLQVKVAKVKVKGGKAGGKGGGKGGKGGKGGRGTSLRKLTNNIKLNAVAPIQMIMPMILALQSAALYVKNFALPIEYQLVFLEVFQFFSLVWFSIPALPDLFFAVFQFVISIGVTLLLIYYCVSDHDEWLAFVGAYAAKRDELDKAKIALASQPPKTKSQRKALLVQLGEEGDLDDDELFSENYKGAFESYEKAHVSDSEEDDVASTPATLPLARRNWYEPLLRYVLPLRLTIPMDEFIDKSRRSNLVGVKRSDLVPAVVARKNITWEMEYVSSKSRYVCYDADHRDAPPLPLIDVGYLCPLHRSILCEAEQRDTCVAPYQCFTMLGDQRCKEKEGTMFVCKSRMPDGKFCPYSLCQTHMRTSVTEFIKISIKTSLMEMFGEGISAFLAFLTISLTSVIYFPVVQTCLQFLVCDPQYQCLIPHCWGDPDALFVLAASVVILVLFFVGVGMPLAMFWELNRRKKVLFALFHRKEYHKIYLALDEEAMEELEEREKAAKLSMFSTDKEDATDAAGVFGFFAKFFSKAITGETVEEEAITEHLSILRKNTVDFGEWERFLSGDNSAMQVLYRFLEYEYLTLPPFLMLYRVAVLIPTIFVMDDMFVQMTSLAAVEVGFGVFIFWTEPYVNPWIDTMYRAGSVHNIMLIGLASINVMLSAENSDFDLTNVALLVTGVYFLFVVGLIVMTTVWPTLSVAFTQMRVASQMKGVGMRTIDMSSVFLNPLIHSRLFCPIVETLRSYEDFIRRHPEANPGDDVAAAEVDDDRHASDLVPAVAVSQDELVKKPANGELPQPGMGTVGEGLLGALPGVPAGNSRSITPSSKSPQPRSREEMDDEMKAERITNSTSKSPQPKTFLQSMMQAVAGNDPDDCEDDLQDAEQFDE